MFMRFIEKGFSIGKLEVAFQEKKKKRGHWKGIKIGLIEKVFQDSFC